MRKRILAKVTGIENANLEEIKKVKNAVETIRDFARKTRDLTENGLSVEEKVTIQGEENKGSSLYLSMTVEVEGLEDIMGNITALTEKLKEEIEKMDKAIIAGIEKKSVKN